MSQMIGQLEIPGPKTCGRCIHWASWSAFYEDPLEPDDCGDCWCKEPTSLGKTMGRGICSDETCEHFKLRPYLEPEGTEIC